MRKINPICIFNILLFLFVFGGFILIYFLIKFDVGLIGIICVSLITLFLSFLIYTINFGIPSSNIINQNIQNRKKKLSFTDTEINIFNPTLEKKIIISWKSIEAIFLLNKIPLDGEYHNFEYSIILNSEPTEVKYEIQNWFNKITIFPKLKRKGLPIIRINDESNLDFHTFYEAINKYLPNINNDTENYLNLKFGNEIKFTKSGNSTKSNISNPIKTVGFYKIYDKGNKLNDENLNRFREETNK